MKELDIRPGKNPMRVWIVEDDETIAEIARGVAEKHGHTATVHTSAEAAFAALQAQGPDALDIALLDIHLPQKDGEWLCQQIRGARFQEANPDPSPWIIIHSTETNPEKIGSLLESGANDHLGKPLRPEKLAFKLMVAAHNLARIRGLKLRIKMLERAMALGNPQKTDAPIRGIKS